MADAATASETKFGWGRWVVGGLSLLWNGFGALDYTLTKTHNATYLASYPPEMIRVIDAYPLWVTAAWACGVWGALAGSVLLLARSRFALHAFAISVAGLVVTMAYEHLTPMPAALKSPGQPFMTTAIVVIALFLLWYAWSRRAALR